MAAPRKGVPHENDGRGGDDGVDMSVFLDEVVKDGRGWWEAQKEYTTLVVGERIGKLAGMLMSTIVVVLLVAGVLLMFTLALGLWLGNLLGSLTLGFLCVAGIHLVLTLLFLAFGRKTVSDAMALHIINAIHAKD